MDVLHAERNDLMAALNGWRYFARRTTDATERALALYCQAASGQLSKDASLGLFTTLAAARGLPLAKWQTALRV